MWRLLKLGVPISALGVLVDGELPAWTAEWLITIDAAAERAAHEKRN